MSRAGFILNLERSRAGDIPSAGFLRNPFNILWPDIAPIPEDQVLRAPGNNDFIVIPVAEVAGFEPAIRVGEGLQGLINPEISCCDGRTTNNDTPHLPVT